MEILGMLGSFIGVIPGIILYVVLTRINFYGSIAAIVMYYCAVGGYHFLIEKLKKKDYDEFQERKSRFNTITRENFSPFGMVFSAIPGIIGVYLAELINFILDLKANNPGVPIGKITSYAMENIFSSEYPYLVYGVISCGLIVFSAGVLVYQSWKMKKN